MKNLVNFTNSTLTTTTTTTSTSNTTTTTTTHCQINTFNTNLNKNKTELNCLLMSQLDKSPNQSSNLIQLKNKTNLTNLRDVLKAAHTSNNNNQAQLKHKLNFDDDKECLTSLIEFLRLDNNIQDNQDNLHNQPQFIINKIEKDLQESLKLLKQYNQTLDAAEEEEEEEVDEESDNFYDDIKLIDSKMDQVLFNNLNTNDQNKLSNFNRNDLIRKNILKKYNLTKQQHEELTKMIDDEQQDEIYMDKKRRNSMDHVQTTKNSPPPPPSTNLTKSSTSSHFNYDKLRNDQKNQFSSGFWNYDELNELKMKFISLLSDNSISNKNEELDKSMVQIEQVKSSLQRNSNFEQTNQQKLSSMSFVGFDSKPISTAEQLKIESFYRSFGTSLFISSTCASLFTVPNSKIKYQQTDLNRTSILTTNSIKFSSDVTNSNKNEISHDILRDIVNNKYEDYVSVYHRGVPLWLFNSGKNPRRPNRQLKFTLAEKGTGFILWQDRIDFNSEFNFYLNKKNDSSIQNISSYFDNLNLINELKQEQVESILITFKASDKKTTVFLKFDNNLESIKFYEYYKRLVKNIIIENKQRTKSLPIGIGNTNTINNKNNKKKISKNENNIMNRFKNGQNMASNVNFYNYDYNMFENNSSCNSPSKSKSKRQSCHLGTTESTTSQVKLKKITKSDISNPCNYKHIISLKTNDKNSFYTLSKLLPVFTSTNNSIIYTPDSDSNKSTPSPSYSITSSPCSISYQPTQETSNLSFSQENTKLTNQSLSSSSSSSLATILPPIIHSNKNANNFFDICSYNQKLSKQRTVK